MFSHAIFEIEWADEDGDEVEENTCCCYCSTEQEESVETCSRVDPNPQNTTIPE